MAAVDVPEHLSDGRCGWYREGLATPMGTIALMQMGTINQGVRSTDAIRLQAYDTVMVQTACIGHLARTQ